MSKRNKRDKRNIKLVLDEIKFNIEQYNDYIGKDNTQAYMCWSSAKAMCVTLLFTDTISNERFNQLHDIIFNNTVGKNM